jgi:hypothetical protein
MNNVAEPRSLLAILILTITSAPVFGQLDVVKENLLKINHELYEAVWKADNQVRRRIASPDLIYISYEGEVLSRSQWIAKVKNPARPTDSYRIDDIQIEIHGHSATVTGRLSTFVREEYKNGGFKEGLGQYRYTDLYLLEAEGWKLAVSQLKPIEKDLWDREIFDEMRRAKSRYPAVWFEPINDSKKPDWEILPQEAKPGEVILSKRNELGILSNFAATPFVLDGKRYASVEGFWQMMLYPEGPDDPRAKHKGPPSDVKWKYTREQVAQMTAFEAKTAGTLAEENMKKLGIDWVTYNGKRFPYRSQTPGEHHRLIVAAMRAKLEQNPEVKRILLATGDLILKPDHHGEANSPPEWKYYEIWMQLRAELMHKPAR